MEEGRQKSHFLRVTYFFSSPIAISALMSYVDELNECRANFWFVCLAR